MSIIKKPSAVDSPYVDTTPAAPTRLASSPVAGGGVNTVAADVAPTVSANADANTNASSTGSNVSYYTSGIEGVAGLASYGRVFAGANVYVTLEEQKYITYNQNFTGNGTVGGANGQIQFNNNGSFDGSANLTFDGSTLSAVDITAGNVITPTVYNNGMAMQGYDYVQMQYSNAVALPVSPYDLGTGSWFYLDSGGGVFESNTTGTVKSTRMGNDGSFSAQGNITGNYFIGNGSQLTGISGGSSNKIFNGNSYANIANASGNLVINANGNIWSFNTNGNLTFPDNSGCSWPINQQRYGMGNIGAWLDGQWTIGEFSGNGVSGQVGIRIDPGIEGNTGITIPSQADSVSQPVSIYNTGGGGIELYTGANNWTFGSDGNLTLPNDANIAVIGNVTQFNTGANGFLSLNSYDAGGNNIAAVNLSSIDGLVGISTYDPATDSDYHWSFNNNGSTIFPTLDTPYGDQPTGNQTGPTLRIGDGINDGIISTPDGTVTNSYTNIVLQPGTGYDDSRGGKTIIHGGRGGPTAGSGGGDVRIFGGYGTGGGSGGDIELYPGNSANADNAGSVRIVGTNYSQLWQFNNSGNVIFPTLTVNLHNGGNQSGQTLQFGDPNQQAFITGPTPPAGQSAQRLIIQGQNGGDGEGGDVYIWGGDSNVNGGDIKIYAGDADTAGIGGNIHITGGRGTTTAGEITLIGGRNDGGTGAYVGLTGGLGLTGGAVSLTGGYGADGDGGAINIGGGTAAGGLSYYGNVNITAGASYWNFGNDGNLTVPGNIVHGNARLSLHENNSNTAYLTSTTDDSTALYMDTTSAQLYSSSILVTGTGNNGVYIGTSNTRIVQDSADSSQVGNIELRTSLNNQNYAWVFDSTGNLTTPGSGGDITGANVVGAVTLSATGVVKTGVFVTGNIPSAVTAGAGARAFVSDADIRTWGNLYVGGAGNAVPVWSNGTNWYIG